MSEEEKKFLEIVDLKKGFGSGQTRQEVLRGMNFSVAKGEFCVLLGPSGSGKSTLLNIIGGIDNADSGYININGDKLEDMSEKKLTQYRRKHLGYVFQMYNLIGNLNVKENIEVGAYLSDNALDIDDLLHTLGLYEHRYKLPNQLSGGQQQRVSIGRAIVKNPDILLCDEPTGALDYNTSKEILKLIEEVNKKYGNTIIMVTHNEAIKNMADHVIKLRDGAVRHNDINTNKVSAEDLEWKGGCYEKNQKSPDQENTERTDRGLEKISGCISVSCAHDRLCVRYVCGKREYDYFGKRRRDKIQTGRRSF